MVELLTTVNNLASNFSLAEALELIKPLLIFILGVAVYSIFIFHFYRFIARREIFKFNLKKYENHKHKNVKGFFHVIFYIIKHVIIFPILTFFWFLVMTMILAFLSRQDNLQPILLITIALVAVIRIMAYYNEDLSKDLAKMLPFALLGVFLVDITFFSAATSLQTIGSLPEQWKIVIYYLVFIIVLEFVLRIIYSIIPKKKKHQSS